MGDFLRHGFFDRVMTEEPLSGPLYSSNLIFDFQIEGTSKAYFNRDALVLFDTGLGKTHVAMMLAALLFEDGLIDHVIVACEQNKVSEWLGDFRRFTKLDTKNYRTSVERREAMAADPPQVLVATYETYRNDMAEKVPGKARALRDRFFTEAMTGKRVLVIYDEMTKLKNRSNMTYRAHEHFLRAIRKGPKPRVIGLTATPLERDPENILNLARLIDPKIMTVAEFERDHIKGFDEFRRPYGFKNLGPSDTRDPGVTPLSAKLAHLLIVKSKSDPDVRSEFPSRVEEFSHVEMTKVQGDLYRKLCSIIADEESNIDTLAARTVLRQVASIPESLALSQGRLATEITASIGREGLARMGSGKLERLQEMLGHLVHEQGLQVVVFTFFGQSVLPIIARELQGGKEPFSVAQVHGGNTRKENDDQRAIFAAGNASVLLSSDAGSRGVNLTEANWVINFEMPELYSTYDQRINRNHRIVSEHSQVWAHSMISAKTIEESMATSILEKNSWFDAFIDSSIAAGTKPHRLSAIERRLMVAQSASS